VTLDAAARYAPIATTIIAIFALLAAVASILVQRAVARRRAAIDFFLKTEMDKELLNAFSTFNTALDKVAGYSSIEKLSESQTYQDICNYLSVHELMALGVRNKVFDERICYAFWRQVLAAATSQARPVIDHVRAQPYCAYTYDDLLWLSNRWSKPGSPWQRWRRGLNPCAPE